MNTLLVETRKALGSPWRIDHKPAMAAAIVAAGWLRARTDTRGVSSLLARAHNALSFARMALASSSHYQRE